MDSTRNHPSPALPPLPATGVVTGDRLGDHRTRQVLVPTGADPNAPAAGWAWRTIVDVQHHPEGSAWKTLITDHGSQTIVSAVSYSVRPARPAPAEASDG